MREFAKPIWGHSKMPASRNQLDLPAIRDRRTPLYKSPALHAAQLLNRSRTQRADTVCSALVESARLPSTGKPQGVPASIEAVCVAQATRQR